MLQFHSLLSLKTLFSQIQFLTTTSLMSPVNHFNEGIKENYVIDLLCYFYFRVQIKVLHTRSERYSPRFL